MADLHRHAEGWSWLTYTMTATWPGGTRGYAFRREPEDGLLAPYDIRGQYRLHRAVLDHSSVPLPDLYWLELDRRWLGMPFYVMQRMDGVVPVQWRGRDHEIFPTPEVRRRIGLAFVDVLARIHAIDWRAAGLGFLGPHQDADHAAQAQIDVWQRMYEESALLEVPVVREALVWLRRNMATSGRVTLCHGDFRIGNFMLERAGSTVINAVFDWELAHLSDPVEDLAYFGLPLFRGRSTLLSQLLEPDECFARYEELTGLRIQADVFRFWTVLGLVKAAASHLRGMRAFEEGLDDVRLAAMGHQSLYLERYLREALEV